MPHLFAGFAVICVGIGFYLVYRKPAAARAEDSYCARPALINDYLSLNRGHRYPETMPTDACLFVYGCKHCGVMLRPNPGDCCVFCSFGSAPVPRNSERLAGVKKQANNAATEGLPSRAVVN
jgi:hypothetical protein